ncbi:ABC transporter permease [Gracilibacillus alcaliphilus]|uniref:ABC transporter permease n=1 Tax=Gracilibacillus alcaliphilus TaxID=1401441 RepID=UPI001EF9452A|nr:ABC transporter permease [Gracilibacillus alcaliphilus]MBM7678747.1 ABC-type dipeptide/oligopeptide/nickel transport system permease component [Gracilibacillus alcaliphilus]
MVVFFKRCRALIITLFGVTALSFLMANISIVDPAEAYARNIFLHPTEEQIVQIRNEMGLDQPLYEQYIQWLGSSLRGDLGISLQTKNTVVSDIGQKLPITMQLVSLALLWVVVLTIPVSLVAALRQNSWFDHLVRVATILGASLPNFWLGFLVLLFFAVTFPIVEVVDGNLVSLVFPSLVLATPLASISIRLLRATLLSNLNKDYVTYAKARGLRNGRIVWGHVMRNSLPPLVMLFCQYIGHMLAGSAIVESIFSMQGIGTHLVDAIMARDLPTVNGCVLIIAMIFVFGRTLADIINKRLNPRMINRDEVLYD